MFNELALRSGLFTSVFPALLVLGYVEYNFAQRIHWCSTPSNEMLESTWVEKVPVICWLINTFFRFLSFSLKWL